jgi:hypothetical protein
VGRQTGTEEEPYLKGSPFGYIRIGQAVDLISHCHFGEKGDVRAERALRF